MHISRQFLGSFTPFLEASTIILTLLSLLNATNIKLIVSPGRLKGQHPKGEDLYRSPHIKHTPLDNFE